MSLRHASEDITRKHETIDIEAVAAEAGTRLAA